MEKGFLLALLSVVTLNGWAAVSNVYWKTWSVLPTVYDLNTAANWAYAEWSTAYTPDDLKTTLPLIRTPSSLDASQVTVTLDGEAVPGVSAVLRADQSQNILGVKYLNVTLLLIQ